MRIKNKIYYIDYFVEDNIFVNHFGINKEFQGRKYSYRIFESLQKKHDKPIYLECYPTLYEFYLKLGFCKIEDTYDGYFVMRRDQP